MYLNPLVILFMTFLISVNGGYSQQIKKVIGGNIKKGDTIISSVKEYNKDGKVVAVENLVAALPA